MFNLHIKKVRKKLGLTQKELAEKCGLSQSYISQLESNLRVVSPTLQTVEVIAENLRICPYILMSYDCNKCTTFKLKGKDIEQCRKESTQQALELHEKDAKDIIEYINTNIG